MVAIAVAAMVVVAIVGRRLNCRGGAMLVVMLMRAGMFLTLLHSDFALRITGVGMVRTTSERCVKHNYCRRQDGDDVVEHEFGRGRVQSA